MSSRRDREEAVGGRDPSGGLRRRTVGGPTCLPYEWRQRSSGAATSDYNRRPSRPRHHHLNTSRPPSGRAPQLPFRFRFLVFGRLADLYFSLMIFQSMVSTPGELLVDLHLLRCAMAGSGHSLSRCCRRLLARERTRTRAAAWIGPTAARRQVGISYHYQVKLRGCARHCSVVASSVLISLPLSPTCSVKMTKLMVLTSWY
jgi:hypothetical protein